MDIKIGTLNTQNNKINRSGGLTDIQDNAEILANYIKENGYYFLGTQELTRVFSNRLVNNLDKYKLYGNYRYGSSNLVRGIKSIEDWNENNAIITSGEVLHTNTSLLPWISNNPKDLIRSLKEGSIMPRIVTMVDIVDPNMGIVHILNTHLDYNIVNARKQRLKKLYKIIKMLKNERVVLTGDFNMEITDEHFKEFIMALEQLGLTRIPVNDKTNAEHFSNKTAIDHIFIPDTWMIEKAGLITELNGITDHYGVYADVKVR